MYCAAILDTTKVSAESRQVRLGVEIIARRSRARTRRPLLGAAAPSRKAVAAATADAQE